MRIPPKRARVFLAAFRFFIQPMACEKNCLERAGFYRIKVHDEIKLL